MADSSDVETALVALVSSALYPNGQSGNPPLTVTGQPARIYRGWPDAKALDADLRGEVFNVSVYPRPNVERKTTRYPRTWSQPSIPSATYTLSSSGSTVTVGGAAPSPYFAQNLAVFVSGKPYVVTAASGQTPAQIAAALLALIQADWPAATLSGAVITLPSPAVPGASRVGVTATSIREVKRQEKQYQIVFWCPSPASRDAAVAAVDAVMGATDWLSLADGSMGRLIYSHTLSNDAPEKELLYRRDLFYTVEYATTQTETDTQIVVVETNLEDQFSDPLATSYA